MYREKTFRVRPVDEVIHDMELAAESAAPHVEKLFVADGDALIMDTRVWMAILERAKSLFPNLRRVSCYAMARNVLAKSPGELSELAAAGLKMLYVGPESGDDVTLKRIAKGDNAAAHVNAAEQAHRAGMSISVIALLGIGMDRAQEHAEGTADLVTKMDPEFFSALTVTVVPNTPLATLSKKGKFQVPPVEGLLRELRTMVDLTRPSRAVFRTNHASNYLPLAGTLPRDRERIVEMIDHALAGNVRMRPEWSRGL